MKINKDKIQKLFVAVHQFLEEAESILLGDLEDNPINESEAWEQFLNDLAFLAPEEICKRFNANKPNNQKYTLKQIAKKLNLSTEGKKKNLVIRIYKHLTS